MPAPSSPDVAGHAGVRRLTLPSACDGRCTPRWRVRSVPYLWLGVPAILGAVLVLVVALQLLQGDGVGSSGLLVLAALFLMPVGVVALRARGPRRRLREGRGIPVTVYYGRRVGPFLDDPPRPRPRYKTSRYAPELLFQPLLLVAAEEGRLWVAQPDRVSDHDIMATTWRNNPWIAPLRSLRDDEGRTVLGPPVPLPSGPHAEPGDRIGQALGQLGQPDPGDPPEVHGIELDRNDPRTYGGPVPGELLWADDGGSVGLVLHRPAAAPASAPLRKTYWNIEYLFFGTDPGLCCGFYLTGLTPFSGTDELWNRP